MLPPVARPKAGLAGTPTCLRLSSVFCFALGLDASVKMFLPLPGKSWQPVWLQQDL